MVNVTSRGIFLPVEIGSRSLEVPLMEVIQYVIISLRSYYFLTIAIRDFQMEFSIARLNLKYPEIFVVVIIHTVHVRNALFCQICVFNLINFNQTTSVAMWRTWGRPAR